MVDERYEDLWEVTLDFFRPLQLVVESLKSLRDRREPSEVSSEKAMEFIGRRKY